METWLDRRRVIQGLATGAVVAVAGCMGDSDDDEDDGTSATDQGDDDDHDDDHDDGPGSDGLVYAFAPNEIAIIDPESGEVVDEVEGDFDDEGWGDPRITHDHSEIYVIRESPSQVLVIDTETRELVSEVDVGPGPTHMYHPRDDEIWAHADDEGAMYVIDTDSHEVTNVVQSGLDDEGHGKLLYHDDFGSNGYATNVNDPGAPVIDMDAYERSDFIEFDDVDDQGTHYKAYSPENGLAYFEFGDETVVVDVETDEIVDRLDFAGGMYLTPDEQWLGFLDGDTIRFIDVTDDAHEEVGTVEIEGGPDALRYHETDETTYAITANTMNDRSPIIDLDTFEVVDELDVGYIVRPDDAPFLHRTGIAGGGYFVTPAEEDGFVAVVDIEAREVAHVDVEEGVDTVQYVGDSGTGHTGT